MKDFKIIRELFQIEEDCGYNEADLSFWIQNYGTVPKVLMDYYTQLGRHEVLNSTQDFLIAPEDFPDYEDPGHLVFYSENQGVCLWGIRTEDLPQNDPPVYECYGGDEWFLTTKSLTEFLVSMAHLQAVISMDYNSEEFIFITPEQKKQLEERLPIKNALCNLYTGVVFLGDRDSLLAIMNNEEENDSEEHSHNFLLMYGANEETAFDAMTKIIDEII